MQTPQVPPSTWQFLHALQSEQTRQTGFPEQRRTSLSGPDPPTNRETQAIARANRRMETPGEKNDPGGR
jgi:hypothetical protein